MADDMRYDWLQFMPNVQTMIADRGRTFTQARCNVPLCQPTRVGLMTGQLSKHHGDIFVGFAQTKLTDDHDNCLGNWVQRAGYRCGLFGKYVNRTDEAGGIDAPAGYTSWRELVGEVNGYEFDVHLEGSSETIKGKYPTDYLLEEAAPFLAGPGPFFCTITPCQPHEPFVARRDLADKWSDLEWPVANEVDVSDKPPWIRRLPALDEADISKLQRDVRGALRELSAVDDMVGRVLDAMDPAVLDNTIVVFTSDNGVHSGEHRRKGAGTKSGPYDVALRVPLVVRGPGFEPGPDIAAPVLFPQDMAALVLATASATPGRPHQAGVSLAEVCSDPEAQSQRVLLHEIGQGFYTTGDGITTGPGHAAGFRKLFRYPAVRTSPDGPFTYEAYDLDSDPGELSNWADDPARRHERDLLELNLIALLNE